jgi:HlyD family secretion protein
VFVTTSAGSYEPRFLTLGVNDWEFTEVIRGVEEGDSVVIISVARLQQSQQEFLDRMRERAGGNGPIPGGSPPRGGGRGGR